MDALFKNSLFFFPLGLLFVALCFPFKPIEKRRNTTFRKQNYTGQAFVEFFFRKVGKVHYLPKKACKQPAVLHNPQVEGPQNDRFQKVQLEGAIKKVPCSNIWTGRMSVN